MKTKVTEQGLQFSHSRVLIPEVGGTYNDNSFGKEGKKLPKGCLTIWHLHKDMNKCNRGKETGCETKFDDHGNAMFASQVPICDHKGELIIGHQFMEQGTFYRKVYTVEAWQVYVGKMPDDSELLLEAMNEDEIAELLDKIILTE